MVTVGEAAPETERKLAGVPLPDYPFASHTVEIGGQSLHYLDEGRGHPVVCLHGNPTWSFYYRHLVLALRETHRCLVPDQIGCGFSSKPTPAAYPFTLERRVADFGAWLDHVLPADAVGDLTLVLHDWGGMIGLAWALENLGRVRRLVLLNTAGFGLPAGKEVPLSLRLARSPLGPLLVQGMNAFCKGAVTHGMTRRSLSAAEKSAYLAPHASWGERHSVLQFVRDIPLSPAHSAWPIVARVAQNLERLRDVPTAIFWGGRDFVFDDDFLAVWRERLPSADVTYYADAGHLVLEDAREDVVPAIARLLATDLGGDPA